MHFLIAEHGDPVNHMRHIAKEVLEKAELGYHDMTGSLRGILGTEHRIDEMAIMMPDHATAWAFITEAVALPGYSLYNAAIDNVQTRPIPSVYQAQYWFLTTPNYEIPDEDHATGGTGYRLEIMLAGKGSPLHDTMKTNFDTYGRGVGIVQVHASFKCPTEESYAMAQNALCRNGYSVAQRCESDYGKFTYLTNADFSEDNTRIEWFVKPRMNLRDAA